MPSYDYNAILHKIQSLRFKAYGDLSTSPRFPTLFFSLDSDTETSSYDAPHIASIDSLSQVLDDFAELVSLCPMTPTLWLQYAYDAGNVMLKLSIGNRNDLTDKANLEEAALQANQVRSEILEAAVNEFPGCDILWAALVQILLDSYYNPSARHRPIDHANNTAKLQSVMTRALYWVGQGTHSYSQHVVTIWKMYARFVYDRELETSDNIGKKKDQAKRALAEVFALRSRTPLLLNDTLLQEAQHYDGFQGEMIDVSSVAVNGYATLRDAIDKGKQYSSKMYQRQYEAHELSTQSQMLLDGLLSNSSSCLSNLNSQQEELLYMGNGGSILASMFIQYAKELKRKNKPKRKKEKHEVEQHEEEDTSVQMFERGISLCPTVDHIWIAYIYSVQRMLAEKQPTKIDETINLLSLVNRAVRNCPYSLKLFTLKIHILAETPSEAGDGNEFDSDAIISIAKDACEWGFLPDEQHYLSVWLETCRAVRRALMAAAQGKLKYDAFDESSKKKEDGDLHGENADNDDGKEDSADEDMLPYTDSEEMCYLIEDLRDCFETASDYFRQHFPDWKIGQAKLWRERANVECNIVLPIVLQDAELLAKCLHMASSKDSKSDNGRSRSCSKHMLEAERCFEKVFRLHPLYLEAWFEFIPFVTNSDIVTQRGSFAGIRKARTLLHRVIRNASLVGPPAGLESLCSFLVSFEEMYGSGSSLSKANEFVKDKLHKVLIHNKEDKANVSLDSAINGQSLTSTSDARGKRKSSDLDETENGVKKQKTIGNELIVGSEKPTNLKVPKEQKETVLIGNLSYPAHPFTVKVSNLSEATEDLDLVDAFSCCGKIVHARILREKPQQHSDQHDPRKMKSKGTGLVQFEERESVAKALELNDAVGLHERLIQVGRSHIPAVSSIVPPGMQRIKLKNDQRRGKQKPVIIKQDKDEPSKATPSEHPNKSKDFHDDDRKSDLCSSLSILSFRPRGVPRHSAKKKIQIDPMASSDKKN